MFARGTVVHLVGAGGAGLGALGELLLDRGVVVSGSDLLPGENVRRLRSRGARILVGEHSARQLPEDASLVIRSAAVPAGNPEWAVARERGLEVLTYAEALGRLMGERQGVAIAGTHGKTTTTGLIVHALLELGEDPSYVLGAALPRSGRSGAAGSGPWFVAEACEFEESFLRLLPCQATVVSIEADHLDYYGDEAAMCRAFQAFAGRLPEDAPLILTPEALDRLGPEFETPGRIVTVSLERPAEIRAVDLVERSGFCRFRIAGAPGAWETGPIECPVPGRHFAEDVLLAAANLYCLGLPAPEIVRALASYRGVARRLETIVEGGIGLLSDYAHHPTEIQGVLATVRQWHRGRRLLAVFQPHQASRTRYLLGSFAEALSGFDLVLVSDIFVTRDSREDRDSVSASDLVGRIRARGGRARAAGPLQATLDCVRNEMLKGDVILLLGAGDIDQLRGELEAALSPSH